MGATEVQTGHMPGPLFQPLLLLLLSLALGSAAQAGEDQPGSPNLAPGASQSPTFLSIPHLSKEPPSQDPPLQQPPPMET